MQPPPTEKCRRGRKHGWRTSAMDRCAIRPRRDLRRMERNPAMTQRRGIGTALLRLSDRLLGLSIPEPMSGCWIWTSASGSSGYGHLRVGARTLMAHRVSYETFRSTIPTGLEIDHRCNTKLCINPDHLEPVTKSENQRRSDLQKQRRAETKCKHGHVLDGRRIARPGRYCRTCVKLNKRRHRTRVKENGGRLC